MRRMTGPALATLWLGIVGCSSGAEPLSTVREPYAAVTRAVASELSGEEAKRTVAGVEQYFRVPGNRGFDASIDSVEVVLRAAGYVPESEAGPGDRHTYRVEERPLPNPAWTPQSGSVTLEGEEEPLLDFRTNRNMMAINSWPTPPEGITAEIVDVGVGTEEDFARFDVRGKIVLGTEAFRLLHARAMEAGALGVLHEQILPHFNRQEANPTAIQFSGLAYNAELEGWVVFLSAAATERVRAALLEGRTGVTVRIGTLFEERPEKTLVADIRGSALPDERFLYSAHVQEPGANDNASGVGLLAEMARTAKVLVDRGELDPRRTLTFMWGDEIRSTRRYLEEDEERRSGVRWGMSLDMVGQDTEVTGGTFLIEKMPDPSAVWTRGEDQHSEWGGRPLPIERVWAHWLNDFSRQRCLDRSRETGWVVKANPFEGGSDHVPFHQFGIPSVLFWHFTDQFYHTDLDRIDKVSSETLAHVGNCALTVGFLLAAEDETIAREAIMEFADVAVTELETQALLSGEALGSGEGSLEEERLILATWKQYFLDAVELVPEIGPAGARYDEELEEARLRIREAGDEALATLPQEG